MGTFIQMLRWNRGEGLFIKDMDVNVARESVFVCYNPLSFE